MKNIEEINQKRLMKEAHKILDRIEKDLHLIVTSIKQRSIINEMK